MNENNVFTHLNPTEELKDFVECYWMHINDSRESKELTVFPDSFFKVIFEWQKGKLKAYFLTGLWTKEMAITIPAKTTLIGIKFKFLAPEYILKREIASIVESHQDLSPDFWDMQSFKFTTFENLIEHIESILIHLVQTGKPIQAKKLQLSQMLYLVKGNISAEEVSNQVNWSNSQINRYLKKYLGVPLKTYLNVQKCYDSYFQIRKGQFYPENEYFDQPHFIREIRKHTSQTPTELFKKQNARFVQLKFIKKK